MPDQDPYRLAVLFLDMLIGEHQLGWLTGMPRAARREKIDETVRIAVKVFLRGCAARGWSKVRESPTPPGSRSASPSRTAPVPSGRSSIARRNSHDGARQSAAAAMPAARFG
jgi:hypothetical protein